jgi:hypothetical protein
MTSEETRRCMSRYGCGQRRPLSDYQDRELQRPFGFELMCRECKARNHYVRRHGISQAQRDAVAVKQGGCAICKVPEPGPKGWVIDHDHTCCGPTRSCADCRRGVICQRCNMVLGLVRDDRELLTRLRRYLTSSISRRLV